MNPIQWYYADGGQQAGPVTEARLEELFRAGTIRADTLVWHSGLPGWTPLALALPSLAQMPPTAGGAPIASEQEIPRPQDRPDATLSEEEILAAGRGPDIGECLRRGWETFWKSPGMLLGGMVVGWLLLVAASMVPCVGVFAQWLLTGAVMGGIWMLVLRQIRRGSTDMGLVFGAFGPRFFQYVLVSLIPNLVFLALFLPLLIGVWLTVFGGVISGQALEEKMRAAPAIFAGLGVAAMLFWGAMAFCLWAVTMALHLLWLLATPLVADKGYEWLPALRLSWRVVGRRFWKAALFGIVMALVGVAGVLACGVGLFISLSVILVSTAYWYEDVLGRLRPKGA